VCAHAAEETLYGRVVEHAAAFDISAVNGVFVIPPTAMSSMSQPGAPVDSSAPMRNRILTSWFAYVVPTFRLTGTKFGHPVIRLTKAFLFRPIGASV